MIGHVPKSHELPQIFYTLLLSEARKAMEAVAEHINEMQKIYEEYGAIFDELAKMFKDLYPLKKVCQKKDIGKLYGNQIEEI